MRRTILTSILVLWSTMVLAQSASPDALYERGMDAITGVGTSRNDMLGIDYFRRSADLGYGPAQIALAYYYETGTVIAGNQSQAVDLYRKAAQQGDPLAGWLAGRRYFLGNGVPRDPDAAQKWLKLSAAQNNAFGAYYLGRLMADRDYTKAPALYKIAADRGLPQAQYFYAKALKDGRGIPQDRFSAYILVQHRLGRRLFRGGPGPQRTRYRRLSHAGADHGSEGEGPRSGTGRDSRHHRARMLRMGRRV